MRERAQRDLAAGRRADVNILESGGMALKIGQGLEHYVVLVELGEERRDLALAESVVERVVNGLRRDTETGSGLTVNDQRSNRSAGLLIGGDIAKLWQSFQPVDQPRRPGVQLGGVGILKRILELRAAGAILDSQILNRLHVESDAVHRRELGLETLHDFGRVCVPLCEGL